MFYDLEIRISELTETIRQDWKSKNWDLYICITQNFGIQNISTYGYLISNELDNNRKQLALTLSAFKLIEIFWIVIRKFRPNFSEFFRPVPSSHSEILESFGSWYMYIVKCIIFIFNIRIIIFYKWLYFYFELILTKIK